VQSGNPRDSIIDAVHLAPDAKDRKSVRLKLDPGDWTVSCDPFHGRALAQGNRRWILFDAASGQVVDNGGRGGPTDGFTWFDWTPTGRFYFRYGRIFLKSVGEDPTDFAHFHVADAWQYMNSLVVLTRDEHVAVPTPGRKSAWSDLGVAPGSTRLALASKDELVLADWNLRVTGSFANGKVKPEKRERSAQDFPEGPWRVSNNNTSDFVLPHAGSMSWAPDHCGFNARLLRSPKADPSPLLVVTSSLVFAFDALGAKLVSVVKR
jgi:hypothetical protein